MGVYVPAASMPQRIGGDVLQALAVRFALRSRDAPQPTQLVSLLGLQNPLERRLPRRGNSKRSAAQPAFYERGKTGRPRRPGGFVGRGRRSHILLGNQTMAPPRKRYGA